VVAGKSKRSILCLGPPHSGKSVLSYLLFKSLRGLNNEACLMDCDYYSPTLSRLRVTDFASPDEIDYIITTPNAVKLNKLTEDIFHNLSHNIHASIEFKGIIVLDGIGQHSRSTESLLGLAEMLIVLCPNKFDSEKGSEECGYMKNGEKIHPFEFYSGCREICMKIVTYYHEANRASFDPSKLEGELFDLDRDVIKKGKIDKIPKGTRDTVIDIAKTILSICYGTNLV